MKPKFWIYITTDYCPACGGITTYRERRYTPRPDRWEDRHHETESWDYCDI